MIRHTEGTIMSSPPGPVTSHLLRWLLFFKMASLPLQITFCKEIIVISNKTTQQQPAGDAQLSLILLRFVTTVKTAGIYRRDNRLSEAGPPGPV